MKLRYDDRQHAYWLNTGGGWKRCKGVTSVAKVPDDLYRLQQWEKRQVLVGAALRPSLLERVAAHVEDRDILNEVAEEAKQIAGANEASSRGSAIHRIAESHDEGGRIVPTDLSAWVVTNWQAALAAAGLEVVATERIALHPDLMIAGRFDRIGRLADGRLVVVDLKSGAKAVQYPHAIAVQLALYANAPLHCTLRGSGESDDFVEAPNVDKDIALVVHMPVDGEAVVAEIDIAAGWDCFQRVILPTYEWRSRRDLVGKTIAVNVPTEATATEDAWAAEGSPVASADPAAIAKAVALVGAVYEQQGGREALMARWPAGVPGPKRSGEWTGDQPALVAIAANAVLADLGAPFHPAQTDATPVAPTPAAEPAEPQRLVPCDEGENADPDALAALRAGADKLYPAAKAALGSLTSAALEAGVDFRPSVAPTVRRFELGRAALAVAECLEADEDATRAALALVVGEDVQSHPLGALIGALTIDEAKRLEQIVRAIETEYRIDVTLEGPRLVPVAA